MNQVLRLTVMTGPHRGQKFSLLGAAECLMGRASECFIQLAGTERDQYISRRHCRLRLDSRSLTVEDLGSRWGTYLNGERVDSATLALPESTRRPAGECDRGDFELSPLLTIGGTTLRLTVADLPTQKR